MSKLNNEIVSIAVRLLSRPSHFSTSFLSSLIATTVKRLVPQEFLAAVPWQKMAKKYADGKLSDLNSVFAVTDQLESILKSVQDELPDISDDVSCKI